jgi:ligand-binding sensor domain-containing protein
VIDPDTREVKRSVTPLRGRNVTSVRFARDGNVWVGTEEGLMNLKADSGAVLGQVSNLPSERILALSPDTGNKLWVGTSEGLAWVSLTTGRVRPHYAFVRDAPTTF